MLMSLLAGCTSGRALQRHEYAELLMGVEVKIVAYADDEPTARSAVKAAYDRVAQLENSMSDYLSDSELMRLCAHAGKGPVKVSDDLFRVLDYAQKVSRASDGAFDVTIGPLVQLWRQSRKTRTRPSPAALAMARSRTGWRLMKLDEATQTVELATAGMRLDLGSIAKGYAGDQVIRLLQQYGISRALFEAGGDIVASDPPPGRKGWTVQTINPDGGDARVIEIRNEAISTSGDTVQFVEIDGVRYSHVVDPRTGLGLTSQAMATVIARRGITSDSLSTAASLLGPRDGQALVKRFGAAAFIGKR